MRVLIITDSFKESLSATDVAHAISSGVKKINSSVNLDLLPFSDGGEGGLDVLNKLAKGRLISCQTQNALGEEITANYFLFEESKTAWIELSQASGLAQIPKEKRNILRASTFGTGLLIKDALNKGCKEIILGVGGSATNDAGAGIFQALGGKLLDIKGKELKPGGGELNKLNTIIPAPIYQDVTWKIACDVDNPLLGKRGATKIYGPQKGALKADIDLLEAGLSKLARISLAIFDREIDTIQGGGAAGGTAAGMHGFFNASLTSGFTLLAKMINLEDAVKRADLIFTAEGKIDQQSIYGKLTVRVAQLAKKYGVPVIGLAGGVEAPYEPLYKEGFSGIFSIQNAPISLIDSKKNAESLLIDTSSRVFNFYSKIILINKSLN